MPGISPISNKKPTFEDISGVLDGLALRLPDVVVVEDDGAVEQVERVPQVAILVA